MDKTPLTQNGADALREELNHDSPSELAADVDVEEDVLIRHPRSPRTSNWPA